MTPTRLNEGQYFHLARIWIQLSYVSLNTVKHIGYFMYHQN